MIKKKLLLKLTGSALKGQDGSRLSTAFIDSIAKQIKSLQGTHIFSLVIGGGNIFRGGRDGKLLGLDPSVSHQIGMLATNINALIIKEVFQMNGIASVILSAQQSLDIGNLASQNNISKALRENYCIIFSGGTGNPFFSTDTAAVLRALQINADEVLKGTDVEGVFDEDPKLISDAKLLKKIEFKQALEKKLNIMDHMAFVLASENSLPIRVFNVFEENSILKVCKNNDFGSLIY